jgi:hypothetical protein
MLICMIHGPGDDSYVRQNVDDPPSGDGSYVRQNVVIAVGRVARFGERDYKAINRSG